MGHQQHQITNQKQSKANNSTAQQIIQCQIVKLKTGGATNEHILCQIHTKKKATRMEIKKTHLN
jgi:hypothetical protein